LAVRMNGDYVDRQNPLSQRALIGRLLAEQLPRFKAETKQGASGQQQAVLKNLYYLQGRMAGGCE
ncbi:MAG: hypothetical protein GXP51_10900, partial [Deltaproteobacteria bacterium]|nr:hypothetical protein [Deltaproteobacteria bacterium]